jgi:adenosylcobinamide kinase/adenosylcobinamide-phosphate guanylyltransferase
VITVVLGGARSGKSEVAERLAGDGAVTYVATGTRPDPGVDPTWAARIARHRDRRPASWTTIEAGADLPAVVASLEGTVLVDSLGTWVAGADGFVVDADSLVDALAARDGWTVVVSDEVGLGVHPETAVGVAFRDALGDVNRAVAAVADEVLLVVAGRVLQL